MHLRPTVNELEELFWRSLWTFLSAALGIPLGADIVGVDATALESMGIAGAVAVANVVSVWVRQKLGTIPQPAPRAATRPRFNRRRWRRRAA